ncbi:MAG: UDP-N-acetylglucosamine 1-carboxyvinyltransferase [Thermoanaerobaculia bacterium]
MDRFRIQGPCRLTGSVDIAGAKNAALPAMVASLLTDQPILLRRLPKVRDIDTLEKLLGHLGVTAEHQGNEVVLQATDRGSYDDAPYDLVKTMRASVLVLGPLVTRLGRARVSLPGGCAIGVRPIDQHLQGLEAMGARITLEKGYVTAQAERLVGTRFRFTKPSVTGTENLVMAASLARGTTILENCAREPEVIDLIDLLTAMGAHIEGAGEEVIEIEGVDVLHGATHSIIPDRIEAATYLVGAALTKGDVTLQNIVPADLAPLLEKLADAGCQVEDQGNTLRVRRDGELVSRDVVTSPHPGFPTDLQAQYMALMTQAKGASTICETIFENRFQHVPELLRMGADIRVEGSYARVHGPSTLSGTTVMATDLRASASLILAGLAAEGVTWVDRIYHLDRGYERMELKLQALGARVERIVASSEPETRLSSD